MADFKNLKALAIHSAKGTAPANFSAENVNDAFREELGKVCSDYITFMKNRYDLYDRSLLCCRCCIRSWFELICCAGYYADQRI